MASSCKYHDSEFKDLCQAMRHCNKEIEKLSKQFIAMKEEVESCRREVDSTRCVITEVTKLLSAN